MVNSELVLKHGKNFLDTHPIVIWVQLSPPLDIGEWSYNYFDQ